MKYTKISLSFEEYSPIDIISSSINEPTDPIEATQNTDPYEADKW